MDFVHSKSTECSKSELDLFQIPLTQVSLEKDHWIDHQKPITFLSPGSEDYVDLFKTILVVRAKVPRSMGQTLMTIRKRDLSATFCTACLNRLTSF
jgi:hypothetical protein